MKNMFRYGVIVFCSIATCKSQVEGIDNCSDKIVIVNAGVSTRLGIAKELRIINELNPKVVGIDFQFSESKIPYQDSLLATELNMCKNLVMIGVLKDYDGEDKVYTSVTSQKFFDKVFESLRILNQQWLST